MDPPTWCNTLSWEFLVHAAEDYIMQVFEAMALSGSGNPRLMAAGVSKATIPTMAGMVSALSGVAMMSFLQRSVHRQKESVARDLAIVTTEGTR